jgi:hypothetical protein
LPKPWCGTVVAPRPERRSPLRPERRQCARRVTAEETAFGNQAWIFESASVDVLAASPLAENAPQLAEVRARASKVMLATEVWLHRSGEPERIVTYCFLNDVLVRAGASRYDTGIEETMVHTQYYVGGTKVADYFTLLPPGKRSFPKEASARVRIPAVENPRQLPFYPALRSRLSRRH